MKVITSGATADMGTLGSNQVMVVTKSGSKEYHGSGYYYKRAEWLNANSWGNNRSTPYVQRGRDRQNQVGFTLGGPISIPKVFNVNKEKLFFFVNEELWRNTSPSLSQLWMPTALERTGDLSKSIWPGDGSAMVPLDPLNRDAAGKAQPFPGAIIPTDRLNRDAVALMNKYPLPTSSVRLTNSNNTPYNYQAVNTPGYDDRLMQSYRVDYNLNEKWRIYFRYSHDYTEAGRNTNNDSMANFEYDSAGKSMGWSLQYRPSYSGLVNITTIINPTTTNELVAGSTRTQDHHYLDKVTYLRKNLGLQFQVPYPTAVQGDYGPRLQLGGNNFSNGPRMGSNLPYLAFSPDYNITDNFTKIMTRHQIKAGIFFDFNRKDQDPWGGQAYAGNIAISRDLTNNPYDTDTTWGNLLTGTFQTFDQVPKRVEGRYIWKQFEWYVSDTWKVKPNLTLDLGVRFYMMQPQYDSKGQIAVFRPDLWDASKTVRLYSRAMVNGKSSVVDPGNPTVAVPSYMLGAIVPGSGDINNGFVLAGTNGTPRGMLPYQGILAAPRIGIAWQPEFLPKTVIRASGGIFYDRIQGNVIFNSINMPPTQRTQQLRYGMIADISNAKSTLMTPPGPQGGYLGSGKIPTTLNWNFAVQRELPRAITFEVAYVGSFSRHLIFGQPMNEPAFGAAWLPQNQDPTKTPTYNGRSTVDTNFYRPYRGVAGLTQYESSGTSNYNSMQVQINKRMSRRLSFGVAYTYSKTMGVGDSVWGGLNAFDHKAYNYGRVSYDRTHVLNVNAIYYLPKFGRNGNFLDHPGLRLILNDWELTGVIAPRSGSPTTFGFNYRSGVSNQNLEFTGQPSYGPRPVIVADWVLPSDQKTTFTQFNTAAIAPASKPSVGRESGFNYWSNPPIFLTSADLSIMKNVPFSKDGRRYVQFRLETYNMLNHHDWTGRSMNAQFASPTDLTITNLPTSIANAKGLTTNGGTFGFGSLSGAASPRTLQATLKIYF
jgi:hypothetical protein